MHIVLLSWLSGKLEQNVAIVNVISDTNYFSYNDESNVYIERDLRIAVIWDL